MSFRSPPAWSMGGSQRSYGRKSNLSLHPGPGSYDPNDSIKFSSPKWRIGTSQRSERINSSSPGPGAYYSPGRISRSPPAYSISSRFISQEDNFTPGPGSYDPKGYRSFERLSPSYSMRPKTANPSGNSKFPGPGSYDQSSRILNQSVPNIKFGTSTRDNFYRIGNTPGPGSYTERTNRHKSPAWGFGTSSRGTQNMSKTLPGPGSYDLKSTFESKEFRGTTMTSRRPDSALSNSSRTPGPGAYSPNIPDKVKSPAYSLGSGSRRGHYTGYGSPGPGHYDPKPQRNAPGVIFGKNDRDRYSNLGSYYTPGPGSYSIPSKIGEGPQHVISPKREEGEFLARRYAPGPGAYSPKLDFTRPKSPQVKIMNDSRNGYSYGYSQKGSGVGPGSYDVRGRFGGPRWGFGSEPKGRIGKRDGPGPGSYNIKSTIGDVPSYVYSNLPLKIHL